MRRSMNAPRLAGSLKVTVSSRPFKDTMPEARSFHVSLTVRKASYRTSTSMAFCRSRPGGGRRYPWRVPKCQRTT
jgi:hypothetical protein